MRMATPLDDILRRTHPRRRARDVRHSRRGQLHHPQNSHPPGRIAARDNLHGAMIATTCRSAAVLDDGCEFDQRDGRA
jgi:hypothetical protein